MAQIINAWFLSQAAMASVLGDWFYMKDDFTSGTCTVYKGNAHNLFGNICNDSIADLNSTVTVIQGLILANVALSVIYFFSVYMKPENRWFKLILGLIIFILGIISSIIWHSTDKSTFTVDSVTNYYGIGWFLNICVIFFAFIAVGLNFINTL